MTGEFDGKRRRLPPLIALRVFECAARHESFTRAAEELCVTQAAVSHQIKALEEWLGTKLFKRLNRSIRLTVVGARLAPAVAHALDTLADATADILGGEAANIFRLATLDSFVAHWVMPRLESMHRACEGTHVRFLSMRQEEDALASGDADAEIRYGEGGWSGVIALEFLREDIFPVASPRLVSETPSSLADLARYPLIHDTLSIDWKTFLDEFDVDGVDAEVGTGFTQSHLTLEAAVAGNGIALARGALADEFLRTGDLIRPWKESLPADYSYYLVFRQEAGDDPHLRRFASWLADASGTALDW